MSFDGVAQTEASHVFHNDPTLIGRIEFDVIQPDQVGVFEVQALAYTAHLHFQIALDLFERDLFAGIIDGEIDLAKPADAHSAFDGKTAERLIAISKFKFHGLSLDWAATCRRIGNSRAGDFQRLLARISSWHSVRRLGGHFFSGQQV
jgi:hypothetical protein